MTYNVKIRQNASTIFKQSVDTLICALYRRRRTHFLFIVTDLQSFFKFSRGTILNEIAKLSE